MPKYRGILNELSPVQQLIVAILLWVVCVGVSSMVIQYLHNILGIHNVGKNVGQLNTYDISVMRYTQIIGTIFSFMMPSLLFGWLMTLQPFKFFSQIPEFDLKWIFFALILILTIYPLVGLLAEINGAVALPNSWSAIEAELVHLEKLAKDYVFAFMNDKSLRIFVVNLFMIAIIPAICEEFFFRGVIQRLSYKIFGNFHLAIIFSATFFAICHFEFYTFLPRVALGLLLGYMYYYSGSLILPIFTHLLNNATAVVVLYINVLKNRPLIMDGQSFIPQYLVVFFTIIFISVYFYFIQSAQIFRDNNLKKHTS